MSESGRQAGKEKIAILGGGMSGLTAAWELTNDPSWKERYESVTVYQTGWRLGGKCASGRNAAEHQRIEEHGLHVWFGCYENAFRVLRACYDELDLPPDAPFPTVESAFHPQDRTPIGEFVGGEWRYWPVTYQPNSITPGSGKSPVWENIKNLIAYADSVFEELHAAGATEVATPQPSRRFTFAMEPAAAGTGDGYLRQCRSLLHAEAADPAIARRGLQRAIGPLQRWRHRRAVLWRLREVKRWSVRALSRTTEDTIRRKWIALDLAVAVALGFLKDGVLFCGSAAIDDEDLRDWLRRHGAAESSVSSGAIQALYVLCFAFENGETGTGEPGNQGRPNFAAGAALEVALRIALTFAGSVCYEMQAGMGEVVIAPIYKVLRDRGVRFEFFHTVKHLGLSADGSSVASIRVERQVHVKSGSYQPLIRIKGVDCWPSAPDRPQIVNGDALEGHDLESHWTTWKSVEERILAVGRDFDTVILATSLGPIRTICADLIRKDPKWRRMVQAITLVQTQSVQLWTKPTLEGLGWPASCGRVPVDATPEPLDVWSDMSQLVQREMWSEEAPQSVQFFCGPLAGDFSQRPADDPTVPAKAHQAVRETARVWLNRYAGALWPDAVNPPGTPSLDWNVLVDRTGKIGEQRLDAQYLRANVSPSELYVQSPAGSTRYRLRSDGSGFRNLLLAGDWTHTEFNAGCIEAATMSGLSAARAITGRHPPVRLTFGRLLLWGVQLLRGALCLVFSLIRTVSRMRHRLGRRPRALSRGS
jgi:uncharacterized protein with NAD-binding domain and iron-sulfur cluster